MENASCSNEYPATDVAYREISDDVVSIVFLTIASALALVCIGIFIEELVFLQKVHYGNEIKIWKIATILGLYPVTMTTSLISLLVPRSTVLLDLIGSCYMSVCFYTLVSLTIEYFGGEDRMLHIMSDQSVKLSSPPCCCCCCCILKPVILTKKSLLILKLCSLQVAVVRPVLLFIAAVLWTDEKYSPNLGESSSYLYITILTAISTLFSIYGTMVIVNGSTEKLKQHSLRMKYFSFNILLILANLQNLLFAILARYDIPGCVGTRGTKVRASGLHHAILVIESFLLALLARKAYRIDETDFEVPVSFLEAESGPPDEEGNKEISGDRTMARVTCTAVDQSATEMQENGNGHNEHTTDQVINSREKGRAQDANKHKKASEQMKILDSSCLYNAKEDTVTYDNKGLDTSDSGTNRVRDTQVS